MLGIIKIVFFVCFILGNSCKFLELLKIFHENIEKFLVINE